MQEYMFFHLNFKFVKILWKEMFAPNPILTSVLKMCVVIWKKVKVQFFFFKGSNICVHRTNALRY
jgi:hypothetical protein